MERGLSPSTSAVGQGDILVLVEDGEGWEHKENVVLVPYHTHRIAVNPHTISEMLDNDVIVIDD